MLLTVSRLCKSFPGVRALHNVDLQLAKGEVLAVIGENGAGKSTLMKILAGVQSQDSGTVSMNGDVVRFENTRAAMNRGIVLIHQELNLCDNLNVAQNIFLGREPRRLGMIDSREINTKARQYLQQVGLDVAPSTIVSNLSIGRQQMVEIAKALSVDARVLIMDEPTSSLSAGESESLFRLIDQLRDRGVSIIYISHRMPEIIRLADRVTVLRDGENAGELAADEINHDNMVRMMVGRDVSQRYRRNRDGEGGNEDDGNGDGGNGDGDGDTGPVANRPGAAPALQLIDVVTPAWPAHRISFSVSPGEIVGIAGLVGAGRTELLRVLFGIDRSVSGRVLVHGKQVHLKNPADALAAGIGLVPEDRKQHGLVLDFDITRNVALPGLKRNSHPGGFANVGAAVADTTATIENLQVKTPGPGQIARFLSGGNQQKVVIGKWLSMQPTVLLLDEPTRGIDVGAKREIYQLMEKLAGDSIAILFVSSELEEVLALSDRVLVMHEGRLAGELAGESICEQSVMQLATGGSIASE